MRHFLSYGFLALVTLLISAIAPAQQLNAKDFAAQTDTAQNAVIIDVRTAEEFDAGYIKHAVNIDFKDAEFMQRADSIDKNKKLYIYCLSGGRSAKAAAALRAQGFNVYELTGGWLQWRAAGLPEEIPNPNDDTGMSLNDYVNVTRSHSRVLIDFYAEWCVPCKLMEPHLTELQQSKRNAIKVVRIDVDKNPQLAKELKVTALPVLHYYKEGDMQWGYVGYLSKKALRKKIAY